MRKITIPSAMEALLQAPITSQTIAAMRLHYANPPSPGAAIDELLAIKDRLGESGGSEFKAFINDKLADLLVQDFNPMAKR